MPTEKVNLDVVSVLESSDNARLEDLTCREGSELVISYIFGSIFLWEHGERSWLLLMGFGKVA